MSRNEERNYHEMNLEQLTDAAEGGDANAQLELGRCYEQGKEGAEQDMKEAVRWYRAAAKQGEVNAQYRLSEIYRDGNGVEPDGEEAKKWREKAREQGHPMAILDEFLEKVEAPEYEQNLERLRKPAEEGDPQAQHELGMAYYNGYGVEQNYAEAVKWLRLAAAQDVPQALFILGCCYYERTGVPRNRAKGERLIRRSAELGFWGAKNYLQGIDLLKDPEDRNSEGGKEKGTGGGNTPGFAEFLRRFAGEEYAEKNKGKELDPEEAFTRQEIESYQLDRPVRDMPRPCITWGLAITTATEFPKISSRRLNGSGKRRNWNIRKR